MISHSASNCHKRFDVYVAPSVVFIYFYFIFIWNCIERKNLNDSNCIAIVLARKCIVCMYYYCAVNICIAYYWYTVLYCILLVYRIVMHIIGIPYWSTLTFRNSAIGKPCFILSHVYTFQL